MSTRTLFIHIPKGAGTSVSNSCPCFPAQFRYISKKFSDIDSMSHRHPSSVAPAQTFYKHLPYSYLDKDQLNRFDRIFSVVRNPWSRVVSLYHHADSIKARTEKTWYGQNKISWSEFLDRMESFRMTPDYYWKHPYDQWATQLDWISHGNKIKCDVLRYEDIQSDLNSYFQTDINLVRKNIGLYKAHYTEYYTEAQKQKVADWFRLDIEHFGFTFESGATRNYWTQ